MAQQINFNPREHLMQIKSGYGKTEKTSDYLPVQYRLLWFRTECAEGIIETELILLDLDRICEKEVSVWNAEKKTSEKVIKTGKGFACFKATVKTGQGGSASATGSESAVDFGDFIEKAETKAIGRALAGLGFGTQFAPELNEGERIVDAPVGQNDTSTQSAPEGITEKQVNGIRQLCERLGTSEPTNLVSMKFLEARQLIQKLTAEYRERQSKAS